jgi:hypothetical protein
MKFSLHVIFLSFFLLTGCVRIPLENKEHEPALMISQTSNGETTLMWNSETQYIYTIFFMDQKSEKWLALRNADRVKGNGADMMVKDQVNPKAPSRRYRLAFEKKAY